MFDDVFLMRHFPCGPLQTPRQHAQPYTISQCVSKLVLHAWCDEHRSFTSILTASYVNADAVRVASCIVPQLP